MQIYCAKHYNTHYTTKLIFRLFLFLPNLKALNCGAPGSDFRMSMFSTVSGFVDFSPTWVPDAVVIALIASARNSLFG